MTKATSDNSPQSKGSAYQWWMISNLGVGAGFSAFVALLIPPYITQLSGSAAEAGVVMAIMSLAAVQLPRPGFVFLPWTTIHICMWPSALAGRPASVG